MKRILPIAQPIINAYSHQAHLHAILTAVEGAEDWLFCNYIQLYSLKDLFITERFGTLDFYHDFYGDWSLHEYATCPWILAYRYARKAVRNRWGDEFNFIKERIDEGEYIFLIIDNKYRFNKNISMCHPILVYGYSDEEKIFYVADNGRDGRYYFFTIDFDTFIQAVNVLINNDDMVKDFYEGPEGICTYKVRKKDKDELYKFHTAKVAKDLEDYLFPIDDKELKYVYGVLCYVELSKYYHEVAKSNGKSIDIRGISSMLDHKRLMLARLIFMYEKRYIQTDVSETYEKIIVERIVIVRNLLLKFNVNQQKNYLLRGIETLNQVMENEQRLLHQVYETIKPQRHLLF